MSESDSSRLSSVPSDSAAPTIVAASRRVIVPTNGTKGRKRKVSQIEPPKSQVKRARRNGPKPSYNEVDENDIVAQANTTSKRSVRSTGSTPRSKRTVKVVVKEEVEFESVAAESQVDDTPQKGRREAKSKRTTKEEEQVKKEASHPAVKNPPGSKKKSKAKRTLGKETQVQEKVDSDGEVKIKVKRKRKTKEEKEAEAMPIATRTVGSKVLIGAHVSSAGGVHNATVNSIYIGGNAFALFLKSQRKWENPPLQDEHQTQFLSSCKEHYHHPQQRIPPIVPHGSYLVNLAHPDADRTKQAYDCFLDDLDRCRRLGIRLYNFHPGNAGASKSREDAISHLAGQLNKAHEDASSGNVITLLETMATTGNTLGSTFEDLANTIELVEKKDRVGVCLDTCHIFAAGYDVRTPSVFKETMDKFDKIIGLKYLKALHMNDSKAPFNSGRDLHANIGTGFLGLRAFHNIINEPRLWGLPMVLETPIDVKDPTTGKEVPDKSIWAREIKLLESLIGMDIESEEFLELEKELSVRGTGERERIQAQVDKKVAAVKAKAEIKPRKKKGKKEESGDEELESLD